MMEAPQGWIDMGYTQKDWDRHESVERAIADIIRQLEERGTEWKQEKQ